MYVDAKVHADSLKNISNMGRKCSLRSMLKNLHGGNEL